MALDWRGQSFAGPVVINKRLVDGDAVELDIRLPGYERWHRTIDCVSVGPGGRGALVGQQASGFEAFALVFTLLSVDGPAYRNSRSLAPVARSTVDGKVSGLEPLGVESLHAAIKGCGEDADCAGERRSDPDSLALGQP